MGTPAPWKVELHMDNATRRKPAIPSYLSRRNWKRTFGRADERRRRRPNEPMYFRVEGLTLEEWAKRKQLDSYAA